MLYCTKLKVYEDDKINVIGKLKLVLERVENIVGKGENAGYKHFLLFLQCFQKVPFSGSFKVGFAWQSTVRNKNATSFYKPGSAPSNRYG